MYNLNEKNYFDKLKLHSLIYHIKTSFNLFNYTKNIARFQIKKTNRLKIFNFFLI